MRALSGQVYRNPTGGMALGSAEAREAEENAQAKKGPLSVGFQAPLVRLSADRYQVEKTRIYLLGNAAMACETGGVSLNLSSEQLQLSWAEQKLPSDTVIEAQTEVVQIHLVNEAGEAAPVGTGVPADAKPLSFSGIMVPPDAKPVSLLLRRLQDEASAHGRFVGGTYVDGAPFAVSRWVVRFQGFSFSADWGGYSEDGQLIYDQRTRVLFLEARTRRTGDKSTLLQLRLADVTMARLEAVLREGHADISFIKPTIADDLAKLGAKVIKRSLTAPTYK